MLAWIAYREVDIILSTGGAGFTPRRDARSGHTPASTGDEKLQRRIPSGYPARG